jgi:hypothetical protein
VVTETAPSRSGEGPDRLVGSEWPRNGGRQLRLDLRNPAERGAHVPKSALGGAALQLGADANVAWSRCGHGLGSALRRPSALAASAGPLLTRALPLPKSSVARSTGRGIEAPALLVTALLVVGTGVDPVTSRFSGRNAGRTRVPALLAQSGKSQRGRQIIWSRRWSVVCAEPRCCAFVWARSGHEASPRSNSDRYYYVEPV